MIFRRCVESWPNRASADVAVRVKIAGGREREPIVIVAMRVPWSVAPVRCGL